MPLIDLVHIHVGRAGEPSGRVLGEAVVGLSLIGRVRVAVAAAIVVRLCMLIRVCVYSTTWPSAGHFQRKNPKISNIFTRNVMWWGRLTLETLINGIT